jgi:phytoene dehydrogenase-like protein
VRVAVIGSGPNGLTAALQLAGAGLEVTVYEQARAAGGGCRSEAFAECLIDHCATVFPLMGVSPVMKQLGLRLDWLERTAAVAHPFDDRPTAFLYRSLDATAGQFGGDAERYRRTLGKMMARQEAIFETIFGPLVRFPTPAAVHFGVYALFSAHRFNQTVFRDDRLRALFAGLAAHSGLALDAPGSAAAGLVLALAGHARGWPIVRGGAQRITDQLVSRIEAAGGRLVLGHEIRGMTELRDYDRVLFDTSARAMARIAGEDLPTPFRARIARMQPGPGVFKLDWILNGEIPWADRSCAEALTVHLGGSETEIAASEAAVWQGRVADRPFVILTQPSLADRSRAASGLHVAWAYCHVPNGYAGDATAAIEAQVERFAPGFGARVRERRITTPAMFEAGNANLVGGDISGGAPTLGQLFARPYLTRDPYATPNPRLFLGSASTPPGGGVHGMCGANAAESLLRSAGR